MSEPPRYPPPQFRYPPPPMFPYSPDKGKMPFPPVPNLNKNQGVQEQQPNTKPPGPFPQYMPPYPPPYGMPNMPPPPYGYFPRPPNMPNMPDGNAGKKGMMPPPFPPMMYRNYMPPKPFFPKPEVPVVQEEEKEKEKEKQKQKPKGEIEQTIGKTPQPLKQVEKKPKYTPKLTHPKPAEKRITEKKKINHQVEPFGGTKKIKKDPKIEIPTTGRETRKKKCVPDHIFSLLMKDKTPRDFIAKIGKEYQANIPASYLNEYEYYMKEMLPKKGSLMRRLIVQSS